MIKETETKMIFEALKKVYRHIEKEAFSSGTVSTEKTQFPYSVFRKKITQTPNSPSTKPKGSTDSSEIATSIQTQVTETARNTQQVTEPLAEASRQMGANSKSTKGQTPSYRNTFDAHPVICKIKEAELDLLTIAGCLTGSNHSISANFQLAPNKFSGEFGQPQNVVMLQGPRVVNKAEYVRDDVLSKELYARAEIWNQLVDANNLLIPQKSKYKNNLLVTNMLPLLNQSK
jgi:hypothetical protein